MKHFQPHALLGHGAWIVGLIGLFSPNAAFALAENQQIVTLAPGWNVVSTPKLLESHLFSKPETLSNFSVYTLDPSRSSGWTTMAELGQNEFLPLYGYFINNKSSTTETLLFTYKASTSPGERTFSRTLTTTGWYALGIANPNSAKAVGSTTNDINNPLPVLSSLVSIPSHQSSFDSVIDFTDTNANFYSPGIAYPWKSVTLATDLSNIGALNGLRDFAETKAYAVHFVSTSTYTGYQNPFPPATARTTADFSGATLPAAGTLDPQPSVVLWQKNLDVGSGSAILTSMSVYASGTIAINDLTSLKLYIDNVQFGTTVASISAGAFATFTSSVTIVPGSHVIKLMADINNSGAGKTYAFILKQASQVQLADAANLAPITPTTLGGLFASQSAGPITINLPPVPPLVVSLDPSSPTPGTLVAGTASATLAIFKFTNNTNNWVWLSGLTLQRTGISSDATLRNISLYSATDTLLALTPNAANGSVTFLNLKGTFVPSASTTILKVRANVTTSSVGESVGVMMTNASTTANQAISGLPVSSGAYTITAATTTGNSTLVITKATSSPSGTVVANASGVVVARYDVNAVGEPLRIENLDIGFTSSDANVSRMRNVSVFLNGTQVGSTNSIGTSTRFNFGSAMTIQPGLSAALELRSDVFDNDGVNDISAGDTLTYRLNAGSANVFRTQSLDYISSSGPINANTLTVGASTSTPAGTLTLAKYASYANQTVVPPQAAYKIGEYRLTTDNTDHFTVYDMGMYLNASSSTLASMSNIYIVVGTTTSQILATGTPYVLWLSHLALPQNSATNISIYADLPVAPQGTTISAGLLVEAESQNTGGVIVTPTVQGQTITLGSGSLLASLDASTPVASLAVGNTMPKIASYKFTAINDSYTINELDLRAFSAGDAAATTELVFKDGATELKRQPFLGGMATVTGLSIAIPLNSTKVVDVYASLGSIGTGFAASGANAQVTLTGYKALNSAGVNIATSTALSGNDFYVYKTKPTIANVALPTTVLSAGTQTIYQFSVTADAGGAVAWRSIKFNVATSGVTITNATLYDAANQSTPLTNTVCAQNGGVVTCTSSQDQEVSGTKTYVLKAVAGGAIATGSSVSVNMPSSGLGHAAPSVASSVSTLASFVWSDESVLPHSGAAPDWSNDSLIKNLPTDTLTMTK